MATQDAFDKMLGGLHGRPDVVGTKATTVRTVTPMIGEAQTFIVQTYREHEEGDTIFLEHVSNTGSYRLVIPPKVADTIARQRDALTTKVRRRTAKAVAADRMARGEVPGFLRKKVG